MTEIKLTKRYPNSRTEDITDAYMRGWNDALDAVQNGKFHIADTPQTEEFKNFDREALILLIECQKERIEELLADKDTPQTKQSDSEYYLELADAVMRGEMSDASANQAWYEHINKQDTPQTEKPKWTKENCKGCKYNDYPYDDSTCFIKVCIEGNKYEPKQTDCEKCEHWKYIAHEWQCETEKCQKTPQTDWYCYITEDRDTQVLDAWQTDCGWK